MTVNCAILIVLYTLLFNVLKNVYAAKIDILL